MRNRISGTGHKGGERESSAADRVMANTDQTTILSQGPRLWNEWREKNHGTEIDLSDAELEGADLSSMNLRNANFSRASMKGASFANSDLSGTTFALADLENALFLFSILEGADMRGANLQNASLEDANLSGADLSHANLKGAMMAHADCRNIDLVYANLTGANLMGASLESAKVASVVYDREFLWGTLKKLKFSPVRMWKKRYDLLLGTTCRCKGVHTASCYGSQRFRFFLEDQDYLEELLETKWGKPIVFIWWVLADCGRSMMRWAGWSLLFVLVFALVFWEMGTQHFHVANLPFNLMTMVYYSTVTFTTLGFGDVAPKTELAAMLITTEVVVGYIMLGGLISIFSNKLASRRR
ncbi:MAG: pentapeptide repeat-containing protein [Nitrospirae bacterium]|nr:pentapeptide repeat-containing protein [Nitrospirota bacterium]